MAPHFSSPSWIAEPRLPAVVCWRGTRPSRTDRSRPRRIGQRTASARAHRVTDLRDGHQPPRVASWRLRRQAPTSRCFLTNAWRHRARPIRPPGPEDRHGTRERAPAAATNRIGRSRRVVLLALDERLHIGGTTNLMAQLQDLPAPVMRTPARLQLVGGAARNRPVRRRTVERAHRHGRRSIGPTMTREKRRPRPSIAPLARMLYGDAGERP